MEKAQLIDFLSTHPDLVVSVLQLIVDESTRDANLVPDIIKMGLEGSKDITEVLLSHPRFTAGMMMIFKNALEPNSAH